MPIRTNSFRDYIWTLLLFVAALFYYHAIYLHQGNLEMPLVYQQRDMFRAIDLFSKGKFIWHGPELTGGGYIFGPFFYWLIGPPLVLFKSIEALIYFEYVLASLCAAGTWLYLKKNYSLVSAFIFYFLFLNSPVFNFQLRTFWNPSFLFIFILLIWFLSAKAHSGFRIALVALATGLALQIHFSMLLMLIALILQIVFSTDSRREKLKKVSLFFAFVLIPMLPYFFSQIFNREVTAQAENLGGGFVRLYTNMFEMSFRQTKEMFVMFMREIYFFPGVIAICFFSKDLFVNRKFLFFSSAVILLPLYMLFIDTSYIRYFIPTLYFIMVAASIYLPQLIAQKRRYMLYLVGFLSFVYFQSKLTFLNNRDITFNPVSAELIVFFAIVVSAMFVYREKLRQKVFVSLFLLLSLLNLSFAAVLPEDNLSDYEPYMIKIDLAEKLVNDVIQHTGWDYEHFRRHSYVVGINIELDFAFVYTTQYQKAHPPLNSAYDGVLMINQDIRRKLIPEELKASSNKIVCIRNVKIENFNLCYYRLTDSPITLQWNNSGYAYRSETEKKLDLVVTGKHQVHILGEREAALSINPCTSFDERCLIIFKLSLLKDDLLAVHVMGDALGVAFSEQSPFFALSLDNPRLIFECDGQIRSAEITQKIGFSWNEGKATFLTPFSTVVKVPCERPASISLELQKGKSFFAPGSNKGGFFPVLIKWELKD